MWSGLRNNEFTYHGLTEPWLLCLLHNTLMGCSTLLRCVYLARFFSSSKAPNDLLCTTITITVNRNAQSGQRELHDGTISTATQ